jgi:hypothetical protein
MPRGTKNEAAVRRALELITEAMDVLDAHDGPPDAAAHLSLAQERLREAVGAPRESTPAERSSER